MMGACFLLFDEKKKAAVPRQQPQQHCERLTTKGLPPEIAVLSISINLVKLFFLFSGTTGLLPNSVAPDGYQ